MKWTIIISFMKSRSEAPWAFYVGLSFYKVSYRFHVFRLYQAKLYSHRIAEVHRNFRLMDFWLCGNFSFKWSIQRLICEYLDMGNEMCWRRVHWGVLVITNCVHHKVQRIIMDFYLQRHFCWLYTYITFPYLANQTV